MLSFMIRLILFVFISAGLILLSWRSLQTSRSHGFARFFAWEALAALILLNVTKWFADPFTPRHVLSWLLLLGAIPVALHGFWLLKQIGKPKQASGTPGNGPEAINFQFENTSTLVTIGAYGVIRHPLYSSLLMLAGGAWLKEVTLFSSFLLAATVACLYLTARLEEVENKLRFGEIYSSYMQRTRMFIPYIF
jgi:protein-S-isoprenylcysteine O-methyltransferase Ste14